MRKNVASNANELNEILKQKYRERIITDPLSTLKGKVEGTLDSEPFIITFSGNEYLLISSYSKKILNNLLPTLTEVMGNVGPICSYDLQSQGLEEKQAMPTIEWDIIEPEKRIKEVVNGRAFGIEDKIHNLKLFNNKKISDYLESQEEKEKRTKTTRIYGKDPGSIQDVERIINLSEVELFLAIDGLGGHIWQCNHDMAHGRIPKIDLTEEQFALEFLVYQTTKFGVELAEPEIDKHILPTPSYQAWYNFYSNHFKNVLTDEEWNTFMQALNNGQDTSAFMPSGKWQDLLVQDQPKNLTNTPNNKPLN